MIAGEYNITIEQGSTFGRLISIEQPDLTADPNGSIFENYSLEGHTARMQIRRTVESSTVMLSLTTENGGISVNPNLTGDNGRNNEISLSITDQQSAALTTSGVYDLEIISGGGAVSKVIRGKIVLIEEVTRP